MDRVTLTVKRTRQDEYRGLEYMSIWSGNSGLHYDDESLLLCLGHDLFTHYREIHVTLRKHLSENEKALGESIERMVNAHNWILKLGTLGDFRGRPYARKILRSFDKEKD